MFRSLIIIIIYGTCISLTATSHRHPLKCTVAMNLRLICLPLRDDDEQEGVEDIDAAIGAAAAELEKQWPRPPGFYRNMIRSKDAMSFLFIDGEKQRFVGHVKASVAESPRSVAVTFVLVSEELRRKGCGEVMMRAVEARLKGVGFEYVYLWTTSAARFYEKKLGYKRCSPVSVHRKVLSGVENVALLESMLRCKIKNMLPMSASDIWMRKRLCDWDAGGFKALDFSSSTMERNHLLDGFLR